MKNTLKCAGFSLCALLFALQGTLFGAASLFDIISDVVELAEIESSVNEGADPSEVGENGQTPLHQAVTYGRVDIVEFLANRVDVNAGRDDGQTPLHLAAVLGFERTATILIAMGATAEAIDNLGRTPLHLAVENDHPGVAGILVTAGARVDALDNGNRAPLTMAVEAENFQVVIAMLGAMMPAELSELNIFLRAVMGASNMQRTPIVCWLLETVNLQNFEDAVLERLLFIAETSMLADSAQRIRNEQERRQEVRQREADQLRNSRDFRVALQGAFAGAAAMGAVGYATGGCNLL